MKCIICTLVAACLSFAAFGEEESDLPINLNPVSFTQPTAAINSYDASLAATSGAALTSNDQVMAATESLIKSMDSCIRATGSERACMQAAQNVGNGTAGGKPQEAPAMNPMLLMMMLQSEQPIPAIGLPLEIDGDEKKD